MVSYFDDTQLDSTLSSTNSSASVKTNLSVRSSSSVSSAGSSSYRPSSATTLSDTKQQQQQRLQRAQQRHNQQFHQTTTSQSTMSSYTPNASHQAYDCYKPSNTFMYSQRQTTAPLTAAPTAPQTYTKPSYDNSMILNHHQSLHQEITYNSANALGSLSHNHTKSSLYSNGSYESSSSISTASSRSSHDSHRTLFSSPAAPPSTVNSSAALGGRQQLFDISDNEDDDGSSYGLKSKSSGSSWRNGIKSSWRPKSEKDALAATQSSFDRLSLGAASAHSVTVSSASGAAAARQPVTMGNDDTSRQAYFDQVQTRFIVYCNSLSPEHLAYALQISHSPVAHAGWREEAQALANAPSTGILESRYAYSSIEASLVKLCDALQDDPSNQLTADVFVYTIKTTAMEGRHEVFVDKFQYVLENLYHEGGIPELVLNRVFTLYVLHLLHFENDSIEVFGLLGKYFLTDDPLWETVRVWIERDYLQWQRIYEAEKDPARQRVMRFGESTMTKEALDRMGKNLVTDEDLQTMLGREWQRRLSDIKVSWTREGGLINIKK